MTETEFNDLVDATLTRIERAIEDSGLDIDCDGGAGILTLTFENGSQIIVNRQAAVQELWVAARSGGFHFRRADNAWCNTRDGGALDALLTRVISEQAGEPLTLVL